MIISIDAMGGDEAPKVILEGCALALSESSGLKFLLHGDAQTINDMLVNLPALKEVSEVCHSDRVIAMDEALVVALRKEGRQSSMWRMLESVRDGKAVAGVSAGNTGALMGMTKLVLKTLPGIDRPALAGRWPSGKNDMSLILDLGATLSPTVRQLVQFAFMGMVAAPALLGPGRENPKIALLNIGSEDIKGTPEIKEAAQLCQQLIPDHFCGFVEADQIIEGVVDVVVTDGFSGNIALKAAEGTARFLLEFLRENLHKNAVTKLGGLLVRPAFLALRRKLDPSNYNGAVFLGLAGLAVKSHGGCDAASFASSVRLAYIAAKADLVRNISENLSFKALEKVSIMNPTPDSKKDLL